MVVIWVAYALFPDPPGAAPAPSAPKAGAAPAKTPRDCLRNAVLSTTVVFPLFVVFYVLQLTSSAVILVFVAILSQQPAFASNLKTGAALLIGNVLGGLAAIAMYNLLVMIPEYAFLVLLTLLFGLWFGDRLMSGTPKAALYGMAFSTVLLVVGSTTGAQGEAEAKVQTRVIQISLAVLYVVLAFGILERLARGRQSS